tara:strand:+ start:24003 stop:24374 length:372 start_codon:yes stop_codon:yes gene_type:complete
MKNRWMQKIKSGFPKDDEYSLHQLSGECSDLSIFYTNGFVQNEKLEWKDVGRCYMAQLANDKILPETVVIRLDGERYVDRISPYCQNTGIFKDSTISVCYSKGFLLCKKENIFEFIDYEFSLD